MCRTFGRWTRNCLSDQPQVPEIGTKNRLVDKNCPEYSACRLHDFTGSNEDFFDLREFALSLF